MSMFALHVARWRGDFLRWGIALVVVLLVAAPVSHAQRGGARPAAAKAAAAFVNPVGRLAIKTALGAAQAAAAVTCPNANPVVDENNCHGAGSSGWRCRTTTSNVGGLRGQDELQPQRGRAAEDRPQRRRVTTTRVNIAVFRIGYYGGEGGRQVLTASNVLVNNTLACNATDPITGKYDCGNWQVTYTIAANALPASGVYTPRSRPPMPPTWRTRSSSSSATTTGRRSPRSW